MRSVWPVLNVHGRKLAVEVRPYNTPVISPTVPTPLGSYTERRPLSHSTIAHIYFGRFLHPIHSSCGLNSRLISERLFVQYFLSIFLAYLLFKITKDIFSKNKQLGEGDLLFSGYSTRYGCNIVRCWFVLNPTNALRAQIDSNYPGCESNF